jgi:gliding motility-associated-like protein
MAGPRIYILTLTVLCAVHGGHSQCPFSASLNSTGNCIGDTLSIRTHAALTQIVWLIGSVADKVTAASDTLYKATRAGSYTAAISNDGGCTVTIGPIVIREVNNNVTPVSISASEMPVCSGKPVTFTAISSSPGSSSVYQWLVNGASTSTNGANAMVVDGPQFTSSHLSNGDIITCVELNTKTCDAGTSNSLSMVVNASPHVVAGPPVSLPLGESIELRPAVDGNVSSYLWSPATGLSNIHIEDPVAMPLKNTTYTLNVETAEGCKDSAALTVNVFSPIRIPSAFTPNGDGKNDIFYILGVPEGSRIKDFSIFNRWGQKIFQRADTPSGDPAFGWNGYYNGSPVMQGVYIYRVIILLADGSSQLFRGTVILLR